MTYDVITVGGGVGGATLALTLAREGLRVLVLERTRTFSDRVRGEAILPWGVNEARDLGVYDLLAEAGALPVRYWTSHSWKQRPPRDLVASTARGSHCLDMYHPSLQDVLLDAASRAGAEVRRQVTVGGVEAGPRPTVRVRNGHTTETLEGRLVVGADGRGSSVREWAGLQPRTASDCLAIAGVLFEGLAAPPDSVHVFRKSSEGKGALLFPLRGDRTRTYFIYRKRGARLGLSGKQNVPRLLTEYADLGMPSSWLEKAETVGPLAEFDGADTWVEHPYRGGVALLGDAAASNDPAWGNGLSLTLRGVASLRAALLENEDWDAAGHAYARSHDRDYTVLRKVTGWLTALMYEVGPEADARRARAFPLMEKDRRRSLDYISLGPETPADETTRRRFFGEE